MFHWIEFRAFTHGTEDVAKVERALRTPGGDAELQTERTRSHFGTPLLIQIIRIERAAEVTAAWDRVAGRANAREWLRRLEGRVDEDGVFHARLGKQEAFDGNITTAKDGDVIDLRAKPKVFPAKREAALAVLEEELRRRAAD